MEIPYIVEARKDTGLHNSKIAIWLFLASEVMLFGGLFSAYIFLRLGADFPWPERALPILPGLVNTAILIASSVTVVFAWAELKLRNWRKFQIYMSITLLCAVAFMCIKLPGEYASKFAHQAIRTQDFGILEGHVLKPKEKKGKLVHPDSLGNYFRIAPDEVETYGEGENVEKATAFKVSVNVTRFYAPYFETILGQTEEMATSLYLGKNKESYIKIGDKKYDQSTILDTNTLQEFQDAFVEARTNNNTLNATLLRQAWIKFRADRKAGKYPEYEGKADRKCVAEVSSIQKDLIAEATADGEYLNSADTWTTEEPNRIALPETVTFYIYAKADDYLKFVPAKGTFGGGTALRYRGGKNITVLHRDKTAVEGIESKKAVSGIELAVDQIDVRHFIMRWMNDDEHNKPTLEMYLGRVDENGKYETYQQVRDSYLGDEAASVPTDVFTLFDKDNLAIKHYKDEGEKQHLKERIEGGSTIDKIWATHMKWAFYRDKELSNKGGITELEKYVVTWNQMVGYKNAGYKMESQADYEAYKKNHELGWAASWFGANHYKKEVESAFPYVWVPRKDIRLESNLTPKWNNYYAIYFTITGLHGLHVSLFIRWKISVLIPIEFNFVKFAVLIQFGH